MRSGSGLCWRTGSWTPALATAECDPDLVKVEVKPNQEADKSERVRPVQERLVLASDLNFDFNSAKLRSAGESNLDAMVSSLNGMSVSAILVVGHADRIGSDKHNRKLSLKKAEAVKSYLMSKGVHEEMISVDGRGESQPLTKKDDCKGLSKVKLISCLQPDRRVEVEVLGTKMH